MIFALIFKFLMGLSRLSSVNSEPFLNPLYQIAEKSQAVTVYFMQLNKKKPPSGGLGE
jgi:hypothetical protein